MEHLYNLPWFCKQKYGDNNHEFIDIQINIEIVQSKITLQ